MDRQECLRWQRRSDRQIEDTNQKTTEQSRMTGMRASEVWGVTALSHSLRSE